MIWRGRRIRESSPILSGRIAAPYDSMVSEMQPNAGEQIEDGMLLLGLERGRND